MIAHLTGLDMAARLEGVMLIEISGLPAGDGLFCVLEKEFTLETGQIIHEYNYYLYFCEWT